MTEKKIDGQQDLVDGGYLKLNHPDVMPIIFKLSQLLNTGLTPETLEICLKLLEAGISPQALADICQQIKREAAKIQKAEAK